MWQQAKKKSYCEEKDPNKHHPLIQCAELILPWLTPEELACISLTCKTLSQFSKNITLQRSSDASRSLENLPIPFHNPVDHRPYAFFHYTSSQILHSQSPQRQSWGSSRFAASLWPVRESVSVCDCDCDCEGCEQGGASGCGLLGLDKLEMGIMSECGPSCECGLDCRNRLTQRGLSVKLKILRDERKGWGLYADQLIRRGQFVCEYAGICFLSPINVIHCVIAAINLYSWQSWILLMWHFSEDIGVILSHLIDNIGLS